MYVMITRYILNGKQFEFNIKLYSIRINFCEIYYGF